MGLPPVRNVKRCPAIGVRMPLLPDLTVAAIYAVVVFLLALGFLVVFIETIRVRRMIAGVVAAAALSVGLAWTGETGVAFLVLGVGAALAANHAFEWFTMR